MTDGVSQLGESLQDRYEILAEVGQGARAVVYQARDLKHDRHVAIKVLKPEFTASLGAERFLKEIGIVAKMTHPHILPLFDSGGDQGALYYVTPFVAGRSLRDRLSEEGPLPVSEVVDLARQISEALDYAHEQGVVHRDIKPENILLESGQAVVADFGIARALSAAGGESLTATGMSVGSPHYMSPEQASGEGDLDGRADLYALGCMMYEMLSGRPPFSGTNARAILAQHLNRLPVSLASTQPGIPVWLDRIVLKLLEKAPHDRFPSAEALTEELASHTASDPVLQEGPWVRWVYTLHRTRQKAFLGALGIVAIGFVVALVRGGGRGEEMGIRPGPIHLAVLCFEDRSPDGSLSHIAHGITSQVTGSLRTADVLEVVSERGASPYCGSDVAPDSVGRALGVELIVSGSLQSSAGQLRTVVELLDPSTSHLVSQTSVTRPMGELFALEADVTEEVVRQLRQEIGRTVRLRERLAGASDPEAWVWFQRADLLRNDAFALTRFSDPEANVRAVGLLQRADSLAALAVERDPHWLEARVLSGWLAQEIAGLVFPSDTAYHAELLHNASLIADGVLEEDPGNARALDLRAQVYVDMVTDNVTNGDQTLLERAAEDLARATTIDPGFAEAWARQSSVLFLLGRAEESLVSAERALVEDAYLVSSVSLMYRVSQANLSMGRESDALLWCLRGAEEFPNAQQFMHCHLRYLAYSDSSEADTALARSLYLRLQGTLGGEDSLEKPYLSMHNRLLLAAVQARVGDRSSALRQIHHARAFAAAHGLDPRYEMEAAWVFLRLGDTQAALRSLETLLRELPAARPFVASERAFSSLRDNPAFQTRIAPDSIPLL